MGLLLIAFLTGLYGLSSSFEISGIVADDSGLYTDINLVLAVDASASMDADEWDLQRQGYVAALLSEEVLRAVRSGFRKRISLTYIEWGEPGSERVVVPWTIISTASDAAEFAARISSGGKSKPGRTSISDGLLFAAQELRTAPTKAERQVIDVSGDGPNNIGPTIDTTRAALVMEGFTINGLAITTKGDEGFGWQSWKPRNPQILREYYKQCVIGGLGAFVVSVDQIDRLEAAVRQKLVLEISSLPPRLLRVSDSRSEETMDCQIGEKNLNPPDPGHPRPFDRTN